MRPRVCLPLLLAPVLAAQEPTGCREAFAAAARRIEAIDCGEVVFGRFGAAWPGSAARPGLAELAKLAARGDEVDALLPLLGDGDARLRTLALLVLYDRELPALLPQLHARCGDEAATFAAVEPYSVALGVDGKPSGPSYGLRPRRVGDVAQMLVAQYYRCAGFQPQAGADGLDFARYWQGRTDRTHCASWMWLRLERATGGVVPLQPPCKPRIAAVRAAVEALPPLERHVLRIALPPCDGSFASEAERLSAARALGAPVLLDLLAGGGGDDPDRGLPFGEPAQAQWHGRAFVLEHAAGLLPPSAAERLLELEGQQRTASRSGMVDARWVIAAAALQPERALERLRAAFARFDQPHEFLQRGQLLVGLHRHAGAAALPLLVEKFWAPPGPIDFTPPARTLLCKALGDDGGDAARAAMAALLQHRGLADADAGTLQELVRTVNGWIEPGLGRGIELSHPFGLHRLHLPQVLADAQRMHPDATARLLEQMQTLRQQLLASLPRWAPKAR